MEFITLESDPKITDIILELGYILAPNSQITDIITDYLGANCQEADVVD